MKLQQESAIRSQTENLKDSIRQLKTEHVRKTLYFSYEDAKEKMAQWINFYNNERLHGALLYLTPEDYFAGRKKKKTCEQKRKASYCRYKKKSLLVSATSLNHLISFPKKVQVHFGQNKDTKSWRMMQRYVYMKNNKGSGKSIIFGARKTAEIVWALLTAKTEFDSAKMTGIFNQ